MTCSIAIEIEVFDAGESREAYAQMLLNRSGAARLHAELGRLLTGQSDHFHLFHEDWGVADLSVILTKASSIAVKQLDVRLFDDAALAGFCGKTSSGRAKRNLTRS